MPTLANAHYAISRNFNSSPLPDDVTHFIVRHGDSSAPDHLFFPETPTHRAKDADVGGRDDGSTAAADLQRYEVAWRHQNKLGPLADDR